MKKTKLNILDQLINVVSPEFLSKRLRARNLNEVLLRQYDASKSPTGQGKIQSNSNSANKEINKNLGSIRENARELVRNQPIAVKAVSLLTNETISWGIEPTIKNPNEKIQELIRAHWIKWSRNCGTLGENFNILQQQAFSAMVVDGESVLRKVVLDKQIKMELLEADIIETKIDNVKQGSLNVENGIVLDFYRRPQSYIFKNGKETTAVAAESVIHLFRKDRIGQNRGVSWLAPVISTIWTLDQILFAQLNKQLLASALTAVVTKEPNGLSPELQNQQAEADFQLTPGSVATLKPGEKIEIPQAPNDSSFDIHYRNTLRLIASGIGATYEGLSSDLSQVNFSSARIGHIQFKKNMDAWRYHTVIPGFCDPAFRWFLLDCEINGIKTDGTTCEWTPPAYGLIDPKAETEATTLAVRAGLQTFPNALKELGTDPKTHMDEIKKSNQEIDSRGLILGCDPRTTGNGQLVNAEALKVIQEYQNNNAKIGQVDS